MTCAIDEIYRRMNDDMENPDVELGESKIREFFAGKTLFLSGATGYVGSVFIEKILRDCPKVKRIYMIVRQKKGVAPQDIMKKYFDNVIFDNLRRTDPNFIEKVSVVTGDLQQDKLGLSSKDRLLLTQNVDVIVHTAATTKFDERVSIAMRINVLGTKHMLDLAAECSKILAFVHVSTGYSHCYRKQIEEVFYDPPVDLEQVHQLIARDEECELRAEALKKVLGKWPNVYTFSKATAEGLVKQFGDTAAFAVGVYRPTITRDEPLPGWLGNDNGPTLIFTGLGLGILHTFYLDENFVQDFVPVDMVVNCLIAMVYELADQWRVEKKPIIYNYGSSTLNPISIKYLSKWFLSEGPNIGSTQMLWYPFVICCQAYWQFWILHVLFHFVPALLVDVGRLFARKKPKALRLFFFVTRNLDAIDYFGNGNWRIRADKAMALYDRLDEADRAIFDFDLRALDWESMTVTYLRGARLYTLKEPFDNLDAAKRRYVKIKILHYIVSSVFILLIGYFVMRLLFNFIF